MEVDAERGFASRTWTFVTVDAAPLGAQFEGALYYNVKHTTTALPSTQSQSTTKRPSSEGQGSFLSQNAGIAKLILSNRNRKMSGERASGLLAAYPQQPGDVACLSLNQQNTTARAQESTTTQRYTCIGCLDELPESELQCATVNLQLPHQAASAARPHNRPAAASTGQSHLPPRITAGGGHGSTPTLAEPSGPSASSSVLSATTATASAADADVSAAADPDWIVLMRPSCPDPSITAATTTGTSTPPTPPPAPTPLPPPPPAITAATATAATAVASSSATAATAATTAATAPTTNGSGCGHWLCAPCLTTYVAGAVRERRRWPLRCPLAVPPPPPPPQPPRAAQPRGVAVTSNDAAAAAVAAAAEAAAVAAAASGSAASPAGGGGGEGGGDGGGGGGGCGWALAREQVLGALVMYPPLQQVAGVQGCEGAWVGGWVRVGEWV